MERSSTSQDPRRLKKSTKNQKQNNKENTKIIEKTSECQAIWRQ